MLQHGNWGFRKEIPKRGHEKEVKSNLPSQIPGPTIVEQCNLIVTAEKPELGKKVVVQPLPELPEELTVPPLPSASPSLQNGEIKLERGHLCCFLASEV